MKKILIVDDEKNIRTTIKMALEKPDCVIETAVNGEEAVRLHKNGRFDIILLDLKMPGMSGIETLKEIMKNSEPKPCVIIITAHGTVDSAVEAMKAGAMDFIQKPFTPKEIRQIVEMNIEFERDERSPEKESYRELIEKIIDLIKGKKTSTALSLIKRAIALDPNQPEGYNLMGVYYEKTGERNNALKYYRAATAIDPAFKPAIENIDRATSMHPDKPVSLGG